MTPGEPNGPVHDGAKDRFSSWVVYIAVAILLSVFFVIGASIFGMDKGPVLSSMARPDFARGLITYLFAVVTIGTAVVLVVSALTGPDDAHTEQRFRRGKEVMSLLLGIFGTIVGYYFGAEASKAGETLHLAPLRVVRISNLKATIGTVALGGLPPYRYAIVVGESKSIERSDLGPEELLVGDGWINKEIDVPAARPGQSISVRIRVHDSGGRVMEQIAPILPQP